MSNPSARSGRSADLLLVEDNPGDARLLREAFDDAELPADLHVVTDGDEALDFVRQRGAYATAPRPDLVLLDWNLPGTSGETVLQELKSEPKRRRIPIIVLTGSQADRDITALYQSRANACIAKPVDTDELVDTVRTVAEFWLSIVRLPQFDDAESASHP